MKSMCWDTSATDSINRSGQKDTEASITLHIFRINNFFKKMVHIRVGSHDPCFECFECNYSFSIVSAQRNVNSRR